MGGFRFGAAMVKPKDLPSGIQRPDDIVSPGVADVSAVCRGQAQLVRHMVEQPAVRFGDADGA
ncbi:hypothetical protein D3C81_2318830 [compost metagenome]